MQPKYILKNITGTWYQVYETLSDFVNDDIETDDLIIEKWWYEGETPIRKESNMYNHFLNAGR